MTLLAERNCLITGASRGLGATIATAFWEAGASLLLVARSASALADLAACLPSRPKQTIFTFVADLSDPLAPEQIIADARQKFDKLDVLVNNAGILGPTGPLWDNDWDAWQEALRVNLFAPVALCRLCVSWMARRRSGKILNISGGGATGPRANFSAYATAKAGLVRFSETMAVETRDLNIDVNCVAPGALDTAMTAAVLASGPDSVGQREYDLALNVRKTGGASRERAAALCVFLASAASDSITGKLISAVWDPWGALPEHLGELQQMDVYTLRRIVPADRGLTWG